jgi:hypothetical protein
MKSTDAIFLLGEDGRLTKVPYAPYPSEDVLQDLLARNPELIVGEQINTLGYPPAALLAFCVGLVSFNLFATLKAALRSVHGEEVVEEQVSTYYLTKEIAGTYQGMRIAIPAEEWAIFHVLSTEEMANLLWEWAGFIRLSRYPKSKRGPKKPPPPREHDPKKPHVSTARLLANRRRRS